jgi:2'-5' RNA ligase
MTSPKARLFYALPLPASLAEALAAHGAALAQQAHGRAVPAANLHVTLAFLGSVPRARIAPLIDIGSRVNGTAATLALDTEGSFRRAGVAWIAPSSVPAALASLQADLAQALADGGFALDARAWRAHVTLARHCTRALARRTLAPLHWPVDAFALYESVTQAGGPRYDVLARWPLSPRPARSAATARRSIRSTSLDRRA